MVPIQGPLQGTIFDYYGLGEDATKPQKVTIAGVQFGTGDQDFDPKNLTSSIPIPSGLKIYGYGFLLRKAEELPDSLFKNDLIERLSASYEGPGWQRTWREAQKGERELGVEKTGVWSIARSSASFSTSRSGHNSYVYFIDYRC